MDTELEAIVRKLLRENKKIAAVKAVRERTNWGLRESKDFVDAIERGQ
ncbi:MAG: ribosomal protein L7/L12, partial [Chloroflexi bacterium]|nr:ribosomal protein L7/L12 [Chloroflexota bacterium]